MASETLKRASMWPFRQAPPELRGLFPEGGDVDWVAYVPQSLREVLEPSLLRWRGVYPVRSAQLPDRSVVYWGAPREAIRLIAERGKSVTGRIPTGIDRRAAFRVQIACSSRYETHSEPKQVGLSRTIDMSDTGIAFTTESLLPANTEVTLHVTWPKRLEGDVPVELHAAGRLARSEAMRAAIQLESMRFSAVE